VGVRKQTGVCADCGAALTKQRNGRWASRITEGWNGWDFCCRAITRWDDDQDCAVLDSADYHYVKGEEQRRFP